VRKIEPSFPPPAPSALPRKRSFLQLPVPVDVGALLADYRSIPQDAWQLSHWDIHCSSAMVLLRGGKKGTEDDFITGSVSDSPLLAKLPYIASLVSDKGPFGQPTYAFIFRMKPMGMARPHIDNEDAWQDPFRVHLPITTNDGAFLQASGRSKHLRVGEVWTFDNQEMHAAVNGGGVRAHLIIDVPQNPKLNELLEAARFDPGEEDPVNWKRAGEEPSDPALSPAYTVALSPGEKARFGLNPEGFASRVVEATWISRLTRAPLASGDILHTVNGVDECAMARTVTDYIRIRHQPGEMIELGLIRGEKRMNHKLKLYRNFLPTPMRRALWKARSAFAGDY
jgi:hypothetical protein